MPEPRDKPPLRDAAVKIVSVLREAGHVAYFAGGCVRDALLGLTPADYDIATDAHPDRVRELFHNTQFVGEAFGVVLVRLMGHSMEVATFRVESGYSDGRRPDHVAFTDARHDAQRRDFTVNGLFEDPLADPAHRIIDFVGGKADLDAGVLRAIGDPDARFAEDYLRMLRAVRFAARLNFKLDDATADAIRRHSDKLSQISRERIGNEVQRMLTPTGTSARSQARPALAVTLMQSLTIDGPTLGEASSACAADTCAAMADDADYPAMLAAWIIDRHVPAAAGPVGLTGFVADAANGLHATVARWRDALCLSNEHTDALRDTVTLADSLLDWTASPTHRRKRLLAHDRCRYARMLLAAMTDREGLQAVSRAIDADAPALFDQGVAPPPLITGDDLIAQGHKPGRHFGAWLDRLYDAQLDGSVTTRDQALAWVRRIADDPDTRDESAR